MMKIWKADTCQDTKVSLIESIEGISLIVVNEDGSFQASLLCINHDGTFTRIRSFGGHGIQRDKQYCIMERKDK